MFNSAYTFHKKKTLTRRGSRSRDRKGKDDVLDWFSEGKTEEQYVAHKTCRLKLRPCRIATGTARADEAKGRPGQDLASRIRVEFDGGMFPQSMKMMKVCYMKTYEDLLIRCLPQGPAEAQPQPQQPQLQPEPATTVSVGLLIKNNPGPTSP